MAHYINRIPNHWDKYLAMQKANELRTEVTVIAHLPLPITPTSPWSLRDLMIPISPQPYGAILMWTDHAMKQTVYEVYGYQPAPEWRGKPAYWNTPTKLPFNWVDVQVAISAWHKRVA